MDSALDRYPVVTSVNVTVTLINVTHVGLVVGWATMSHVRLREMSQGPPTALRLR